MESLKKIACLRAIPLQQFFKEALGDIYSERYFTQQQKHFDDRIFIF